MKVWYQWSEDGVVELCEKETIVSEGTVSCYHCNCVIPKNETAVKLVSGDSDVYILHSVCADLACFG